MDAEELLRTFEAERDRGVARFAQASTLEELETAQVDVMGRRSPLASAQKALGGLSEEDRRRAGKGANDVRAALTEALEARRAALGEAEEARRLEIDRVDLTLPGRRGRSGSLHP